jgi:hypothetical protein
MSDFVYGGYPLPQGPVGLRDFVPGGFPLPWTPVFIPSKDGSLPKAPPMPRAAIAHGASGPASPNPATTPSGGTSSLSGCGCGMPGYYGGMGTLATTDFGLVNGDTIIPQASLPTFLQGDNWISGMPNIYTALGVGVLVLVVASGSKKGRR